MILLKQISLVALIVIAAVSAPGAAAVKLPQLPELCAGPFYCLTVELVGQAFEGWKNGPYCGITGHHDDDEKQWRTFWFNGGCSGQLRFSCPVKYENITIKEDGLVDWAVSRTQGKQTGLSWIHTLDRQIEGQSSEGQIMDAAAKDGDTVTSKIPFVDFILYCKDY